MRGARRHPGGRGRGRRRGAPRDRQRLERAARRCGSLLHARRHDGRHGARDARPARYHGTSTARGAWSPRCRGRRSPSSAIRSGRPGSRSPTRATSTRRRSRARSRPARTDRATRCRASRPRCVRCRLVDGRGEIVEIDETQPDLLRAAQVSVGMLGVMTSLTIEVVAGLPAERADRAPALRRRARRLGRAVRRPPALLVLLAAERGLGRALRALHPARAPDDRHVLRQALRRGRRGRRRRRHARVAASIAATASTRPTSSRTSTSSSTSCRWSAGARRSRRCAS